MYIFNIYTYTYTSIDLHKYMCIHINMYIYAIMKTMCPPGYHHNGFVATHALGHMMYILMWIGKQKFKLQLKKKSVNVALWQEWKINLLQQSNNKNDTVSMSKVVI